MGEERSGYIDIVKELKEQFPKPDMMPIRLLKPNLLIQRYRSAFYVNCSLVLRGNFEYTMS